MLLDKKGDINFLIFWLSIRIYRYKKLSYASLFNNKYRKWKNVYRKGH